MPDSVVPDPGQQNDSNQGGNNNGEVTPGTGEEFKPITSQDDLNTVISDRISRERAKYSDYKDVKAKAARFDELEESKKTEVQKEKDRADKAEAEVGTVPEKVADALRAHLVALHEIDTDDAELFLTASNPELLLKQVERLTGRTASRKKKTNYVPGEGNPASASDSDGKREFLRSIMKKD